MHDISLEVRIEIRGVAKDFQKATDPFLGLLLSLFLYVNSTMLLCIQVAKKPIEELK